MQYEFNFLKLFLESFDRPSEHFVIREGKENELNVTYLANYCAISSPNIESDHNIFDRCQIDIDSANRLYNGKWKVNVGVYGQIDEIVLEPKVTVIGKKKNTSKTKFRKYDFL